MGDCIGGSGARRFFLGGAEGAGEQEQGVVGEVTGVIARTEALAVGLLPGVVCTGLIGVDVAGVVVFGGDEDIFRGWTD